MGFNYDQEKTVTSIQYVAQELISGGIQDHTLYKVLKILYFANMKHLAKWGRPLTGDKFVKLDMGPVLTHTYDIIKDVRDKRPSFGRKNYRTELKVDSKTNLVFPLISPELNQFSDSEIDAINESINENGTLSFAELKNKSHDEAWNEVGMNDIMSFLTIAKVGGANQGMLDYIVQAEENSKLF